ncbi:DUF4861 domain-containing protein [Maribacter dokdonensis]|uniref:DUF4861 domain-containing protein n=1 Tax=Maribacter dokdonensis TaxID=320912 RepID=UPI00273769E3|nr:DUF4861 domain-containing protein [Maribacter dokdonensis]MDP2527100.1 DUF4861 domain-containing protein [Maribacter dokdonensis]
MRKSILLLSSSLLICLFSCKEEGLSNPQIVIENTSGTNRSFETVSVDLDNFKIENLDQTIVIRDLDSKEELISQVVDNDGDNRMDILLFQPKMPPLSKRTFEVIVKEKIKVPDTIPACYSRFVPERTDDYAWENNRVAFRTYGPVAQKMKEDGVKGGTLSSGIDAWLKRVDYPIINKWYHKELNTEGSYHKDDGEGLDNFHVGVSRGVGGIAKKVDSTYYYSKNFTTWKTITTGPIRTSFVLTYENWDANGNMISEEKKISLDYGSNLSKFEITIKGTDTISAGLTLHDKDGEIAVNDQNGWVSYWEPHDDSELGMAIIIPQGKMTGHEHFLTNKKDESNLFAHIEVIDNKVVYYAGFGWKKSNQFKSQKEWNGYLNMFAERLKKPLKVTVQQ